MKMQVKVGIIGGTGLDNNRELIEKRTEKVIETPYGSVPVIEGIISGVNCVSIIFDLLIISGYGRNDIVRQKLN